MLFGAPARTGPLVNPGPSLAHLTQKSSGIRRASSADRDHVAALSGIVGRGRGVSDNGTCEAETVGVLASVERSLDLATQVHFPALPAAQLASDRRSFIETARIRGYEAGPNRLATIASVANLLQEVASNHAIAVWGKTEQGFATDPAMVQRNLIFVMARLQIKINKFPTWGETVCLETWFKVERKGAWGRRDWRMEDAVTGEILGNATSMWVLINTKTRRPSRIPAEMLQRWSYYTKEDRYSLPPEEMKRKIEDPETMTQVRLGVVHVAGQSFMDMNGHINNVAYLGWALDALPDVIFEKFKLEEVEIDFKGECNAGDHVESVLYRADTQENGSSKAPVFVHVLRKADGAGNRELSRMKTSWRIL